VGNQTDMTEYDENINEVKK